MPNDSSGLRALPATGANEAGPGTTDDLVRRAQAGDVLAFESLYRRHASPVFALCRRMLGDDAEARELVQDAFVRAWERLVTFRGQSAFGTWLHRLSVNLVLEHLRATRRNAARLVTGDDDALDACADVSSLTIARDLETRMDLETALDALPAGARAVFVLHDMEGYSHDEIATMIGIAPGTARAQLWRARRTLMKLLAV